MLCASWMPGHCQLPKSKQMMAPPRHQQPLTPVPMPATHPRLMVQTTSLQATVLALALELELELAQEVEVMRLLAPEPVHPPHGVIVAAHTARRWCGCTPLQPLDCLDHVGVPCLAP